LTTTVAPDTTLSAVEIVPNSRPVFDCAKPVNPAIANRQTRKIVDLDFDIEISLLIEKWGFPAAYTVFWNSLNAFELTVSFSLAPELP